MTAELFSETSPQPYRPLADRMRPQVLADYIGQEHIIGSGKTLTQAIENQILHSMVFWGPPGTGKTTLAKIIANSVQAHFINLSAVLSGVKDIREAIAKAKQWQVQGELTILFIDEVHRFNKSQQDAFLPYVEDGTIFFIGATTENPSFELNNALLSRVKTYILKSLTAENLTAVIKNALAKDTQLKILNVEIDDVALELLSQVSDGDARRALNFLEIACDLAEHAPAELDASKKRFINKDIIQNVTSQSLRRFDKGGDLFYEQISAMHKSVRGSNPDAALYWFCRMIDGGCDPLYIARRVVRMASEDIGNADPRGLQLALDAWQTFERLGSPEGELAIAQAIIFLACAAKSNAVYTAYNEAMKDAKNSASLDVPDHLRNAPTQFMKKLGYGKDYRYVHDEENAFAAGETYFPDMMGEKEYYQPVERGLEAKIKQKLDHLRALNVSKK
ncbi:Replication-associated recombination protein RarA [hydrothermal vent metagenome]|uniref:Replication-associated recombination protein RarA n=1 Tax=hydrothermal vent metagenome TaxID=652676 RepID=A0A3B0WMK1_9ZZZZ